MWNACLVPFLSRLNKQMKKERKEKKAASGDRKWWASAKCLLQMAGKAVWRLQSMCVSLLQQLPMRTYKCVSFFHHSFVHLTIIVINFLFSKIMVEKQEHKRVYCGSPINGGEIWSTLGFLIFFFKIVYYVGK